MKTEELLDAMVWFGGIVAVAAALIGIVIMVTGRTQARGLNSFVVLAFLAGTTFALVALAMGGGI